MWKFCHGGLVCTMGTDSTDVTRRAGATLSRLLPSVDSWREQKCDVPSASDKQSTSGKQPYRRIQWKFDFWRLGHGFVGTLEKGISALTVCGRLQHPRIRLLDSIYYSVPWVRTMVIREEPPEQRWNDCSPSVVLWLEKRRTSRQRTISPLWTSNPHQLDENTLELRHTEKSTKARQQENVMSRSRSRYC